MIATGIGLHNFSEGLAIGQSAAAGEISLALVLIILVVGTPAAYLLATRQFRGRSVVLTLVELSGLLIVILIGLALLLVPTLSSRRV